MAASDVGEALEGKLQVAGVDVCYRQWHPAGETRAVLQVVHGLAEHSGRYAELAVQVNQAGYAVCALDLPGHGKSGGTRGHIPRFKDYLDAVLELRRQVGEWYPRLPVFLLGHSMGGLVSAVTALEHQQLFAGLILSGAAIQNPEQPPALQVMVVRLLAKLLPRLGVMQLSADAVSRDPAVVRAYTEDPLNHMGKISARQVAELFAAMQRLQAQASQLTLPLLILHGGADALTAVAGSRLLYDMAQSPDKTLTVYDGLFHEIFNEPEGREIVADVVAWMRQRDSK